MSIQRTVRVKVQAQVTGLASLGSLGKAFEDVAQGADKTAKGAKKADDKLKDLIKTAAGAIAIRQLGQWFDSAFESGEKFRLMTNNLTFSIDKAEAATKGLVSRFQLTQQASRAATLGVASTAEEFAGLSRAAVIASQRMGIDVNQAMEQLILGTARMSAKRLDDLGILIKQGDANKKYAKALGVNVKALSAEQKQAAFLAEVKVKLKAITDGQTVSVNSLGGSYKQLKTSVTNLMDSLKKLLASAKNGVGIFEGFTTGIDALRDAINGVGSASDLTSKKLEKTIDKLKGYFFILGKFRPELADMLDKTARGATAALRTLTKPLLKRNAIVNQQKSIHDAATAAGRRAASSLGGRTSSRKKSNDIPATDDEKQSFEAQEFLARIHDRRRRREARGDRQLGEAGSAFDRGNQDRGDQAAETERERISRITAAQAKFGPMAKQKQKLAKMNDKLNKSFKALAKGGLSAFAQGLTQSIFAAVNGEKSFGAALAGMTKSVMAMISQQATVKAVMALADAFANWMNPKAFAMNMKAFGLYTAAAVMSGGISAAIPAQSSGGGDSASAGANSPGTGGFRGGAGDDDERNVNVNVFLSADRNEAAAVIMQRSTMRAELAA